MGWSQPGAVRRIAVTADSQANPSLAALRDGTLVLAWTDTRPAEGDTSETGIFARRLDATGAPSGAVFLVNATTDSTQSDVSLVPLSGGGFAAVWLDYSSGGAEAGSGGIRARSFDATGTPAATDTAVNATADGTQLNPGAAALGNGRFLATWTDFETRADDAEAASVRARLLTAAGATVGTDILLNTTTAGSQRDSVAAGLADGGFVAAWSTTDPLNGNFADIAAQVFAANGTRVGVEFTVSTAAADQSDPVVAARTRGGFAIAWTHGDPGAAGGADRSSVRLRVFDATDAAIGGEIVASGALAASVFDPQVAALADGRYLVTWTEAPDSGAPVRVMGQIVTATGALSGTNFAVSTLAAPAGADLLQASIAPLADGRFAAAWSFRESFSVFPRTDAIESAVFDPRVYAGTRVAETVTGGLFADRIATQAGDDSLAGAEGDDRLFGGADRDALSGGAGNDRLDGGTGRDALTGGRGADSFVFAADPAGSPDRILDFAPGQDRILLDDAAFAGLGTPGALAPGAFALLGTPLDAADRVLYDPGTGRLFHDANGQAAGGRTLVAILDPGLALSAADFVVI